MKIMKCSRFMSFNCTIYLAEIWYLGSLYFVHETSNMHAMTRTRQPHGSKGISNFICT